MTDARYSQLDLNKYGEKDRLTSSSHEDIALSPTSPRLEAPKLHKRKSCCTNRRVVIIMGGFMLLLLVMMAMPDKVHKAAEAVVDKAHEVADKLNGATETSKVSATTSATTTAATAMSDTAAITNAGPTPTATATANVPSVDEQDDMPEEDDSAESDDHEHHHPTIDYSSYSTFPLKPASYRQECTKFVGNVPHHHMGYWHADSDYRDIPHKETDSSGKKYCEKTLTYLLDDHHGFAYNLNGLLQSWSLAQKDNRTFFVDDTYWQLGKWSDFFNDVPAPTNEDGSECVAPPKEELVACPRVTRHFVLTPTTFIYHLGHDYMEEYENPYGHDTQRLIDFFQGDENGLKAVFQPNVNTLHVIDEAAKSIASSQADTFDYVSLHIRKGDLHPMSWTHHKDYIPIEDYLKQAELLWQATNSTDTPRVYVATDDSNVVAKVKEARPKWEVLAAFANDATNREQYFMTDAETQRPANEPATKFIPEPGYYQAGFDALDADRKRNLIRGLLADMTLASKAGAGTVCTVGSNICVAIAPMMGWQKAIVDGKWVNIDGQFDWKPVPSFD